MSETPMDDAGTESVPEVAEEDVRRLAHELARERPDATPEENWLLAEARLRAEEAAKRDADRKADEDSANLMAKIEMGTLGHP